MKAISLLPWVLVSSALPFVEEGRFMLVDWQESPYVGGPFKRLYRPSNRVEGRIQNNDFATGLASIMAVISNATGTRVRAFGSMWTFSNITYVDGSMVNSSSLNYCQVGMDSSHLTDKFVPLADRLVFVQAGVRIKDLSRALTEKNLTLSTTGQSDGQRVAGALSTGTHGSRFGYGGMEQMILAIHIVTHGNRHVLLQGDAVVNQNFATYLGNATLIQDEKLFNTAKVCFGSCGIIHGYVIQVEPLYELRRMLRTYSYAEVTKALNTLDVSELNGIGGVFPNPSFIAFSINPFWKGPGSVVVTVMDQSPFQGQGTLQENQLGDNTFLFSILELLIRFMNIQSIRSFDKTFFGGVLIYSLCGLIMNVAQAAQNLKLDEIQTNIPSRVFGDPDSENSLGSYPKVPVTVTDTEIAVPLERTVDALNVIAKLLRDDPIIVFVNLRFIKKSSATLGFAKFNTTTTVELTAAQDEQVWTLTYDWFERLYAEFETSGIPHSFHWGKRFPLNNRWVSKAFGESLKEWEEQRLILLRENAPMFRNDVLDQLGIS